LRRADCRRAFGGPKPDGGMCLWLELPPGFGRQRTDDSWRGERGCCLFAPGKIFLRAIANAQHTAAGICQPSTKKELARGVATLAELFERAKMRKRQRGTRAGGTFRTWRWYKYGENHQTGDARKRIAALVAAGNNEAGHAAGVWISTLMPGRDAGGVFVLGAQLRRAGRGAFAHGGINRGGSLGRSDGERFRN